MELPILLYILITLKAYLSISQVKTLRPDYSDLPVQALPDLPVQEYYC